MSFLTAARVAPAGHMSGQLDLRRRVAAVLVLALALLSISCTTTQTSAPNHNAYVTLPDNGSVLQLQINEVTGTFTPATQTPAVQGTSPTGLALIPKKFLYAANSRANTISIFTVNSDGSLGIVGAPTPAGNGPNAAVIDPSGQYLLVTNNFSNDISVFSINSGSGALTPVANSPFYANANPTDLKFTPSGQFVYVTNPGIGMVSAFTFDPTATQMLTPVPGSPFLSGAGAASLAVYGSGQFLYVANPNAGNPPPYNLTTGNISAFSIDSTTGALTPISGSPFTSSSGNGPSTITIDPSGRFLYAMTPGSSFSIWGFSINQQAGQSGQLVTIPGSPFNLPAGGLFAVFDPSGNYLFVGGNTGINSYHYDQSSGTPSTVTGSPFSTGTAPGKMVVAD